MNKLILIINLIFIPFYGYSQKLWISPKFRYSFEVPLGFSKTIDIVGKNVDFKANKGISSIVVVPKILPIEYSKYSLMEILGNLDDYKTEWENGSKEYLNNPKILKYGKTTINGLEAFWFDYVTDDRDLYTKNYIIKKGNHIYNFALSCPISEVEKFSSTWFRVKNSIKLP